MRVFEIAVETPETTVQGCLVVPDLSPAVIHWPFVATLLRLLLALAAGVFVVLEREHRAKAGARTLACASLIGWGGGMGSRESS
jgi:hypothetical protein